jgi:hypothetical protein
MALTRRRTRELQEVAEDIHRAVRDEAETALRNQKDFAVWLNDAADTRFPPEEIQYLFEAVSDLQRHYTPTVEDDEDQPDPRGIPKKRLGDLKRIAKVMYEKDIPEGIISGPKGVFNYVTIKLRQKITQLESDAIREMMEEMSYNAMVAANTVNNAIVFIRCKDAASFDTRSVRVFRNSRDGQQLAIEAFSEAVKRSTPDISEKDLDKAIRDGYYEIGAGFITLTLTTQH